MPNIPYPITADSIEELKSQLYEMLRQLFEDKIGGLDLGDVFLNSGDIMSLRLSSYRGIRMRGLSTITLSTLAILYMGLIWFLLRISVKEEPKIK